MATAPELRRFSENLKAIRKSKGMSQMDLGFQCRVHPSVIGRLEAGSREPRLATIVRLAAGLSIPAGDLLDGLPLSDAKSPKRRQ
jgi:transcriptional regulator with XRE-family HTH domain